MLCKQERTDEGGQGHGENNADGAGDGLHHLHGEERAAHELGERRLERREIDHQHERAADECAEEERQARRRGQGGAKAEEGGGDGG